MANQTTPSLPDDLTFEQALQRLEALVEKHSARDTTDRGAALAELRAMLPRPSQYNPGREIPERSWAYRLAKRLCFTDFGAYEQSFRKENWRETRSS